MTTPFPQAMDFIGHNAPSRVEAEIYDLVVEGVLPEDLQARRALYGVYRSPFTDDPSVGGKGRGVANTTPIFHGGRLGSR